VIGHLAYAEGSPCPTLVLDAGHMPPDEEDLLAALTEVRRWLDDAGGGHVLKIALVQPSQNPMFDLDYRFVQALPEGPGRFDLRGSCGHSILSSILAAAASGMLPRLSPGARIGVHVQNNDDHVVCETDEVNRDNAVFSVHFVHQPAMPLRELLLTGQPVTTLDVHGTPAPVSFVSAGNPYVFVAAETVGVSTKEELFTDDPALFDRLVDIRTTAAARLGWSPRGAFPKIAVTLPLGKGRIAVRAISVPSWHPTLALTGAACLGAATGITGTIPWQATGRDPFSADPVRIDTPGGSSSVAAAAQVVDGRRELNWITVGNRRATYYGSFLLQPLADLQVKELSECLSVSM
jgi:2-methylaconitate cis-trans-isomerase PrpF